MIETNPDIKGLNIAGKEIKITQFANDTALILNGESGPLQAALNTLEIFGELSGLFVNTDKTQVVWIGKKRGSKSKLNIDKKLCWGLTSFNLLGVNFSTDITVIPNLNYRKIIDELPKRFNTWKKRYTTPLGRITILKTLILPKFIHLFTVLPKPNPNQIKQINSMFYKFIWNDKPEKIKRAIVNMPSKKGGLKMIDLEKFINALQLTWIKRYFSDKTSQWSILADFNIGSQKKFFEMGPLWHKKSSTTNSFYCDLLTDWQKIMEVMAYNKPMNMPLWYNPHLSAISFFNKDMYLCGCTTSRMFVGAMGK